MLLKLGLIITDVSGKLGGQSIATTRNGVVIKNIVQPPRRPTPKQSNQRFSTAHITNQWQHLLPAERAMYHATAINYTYVNRVGDTITRNGFQTFCFINQNLLTLGLPLLATPPIYSAITKPIIQKTPGTEQEFIIVGTNLNTDYTYVLFAQIHYQIGAKSFTEQPIIVAHITKTELENSIDIAPFIQSNFATIGRPYTASIQVVAINHLTGNRDLSPVTITSTVVQEDLFDTDYQAVLNYATANGITLPSALQQIAQNQFMLDLKAAIDLTAFDWFYLLVNDAEQKFGWINWANPNQYSYNGTWFYTPNLGMQPRISTGTRFTGSYNPSLNAVAGSLNDYAVGFKIGIISGGWSTADAVFQNLSASADINFINGTIQSARLNTLTNINFGTRAAIGGLDDANTYNVVSRISATQVQYFKNNNLIGTFNSNSTALPTVATLFGQFSGLFETRFMFLHSGRSLTQTEVQAINTAYQTYFSSI